MRQAARSLAPQDAAAAIVARVEEPLGAGGRRRGPEHE